MKEQSISVIIVNYRVKYFLAQTLYSVKEALNGYEHEIFVVDNNSEDDSVPFIRSIFPDINIIANTENVGFAKANNQAIKLANGEFSLILNPDTIISRNAIEEAITFMKENEKCGGIGTKMIDGNGYFLPESKRSFPTPWVSFCKIFGLSTIFPKSRFFARYHCKYLPENESHKIDILAGAYMFIRTELLQKIEGFDESFFMYGEDIDLSYRIILNSYQNYYLPSPIIHYKGESTKKNSMKYVRVFYDAMYIFFKKYYPHYSKPYSFLIKGGIGVRAGMARIKRMYTGIFPNINSNSTENNRFCILSKNPDTIINKLSPDTSNTIIELSEVNIYSTTKRNIIIDNRDFSYQEIINIIHNNMNNNTYFHIYFSQCDKIMTPKMENL